MAGRYQRAYAGSMARLPLFPLETVLFPGARLPLQIFEPRYVALLRDLIDNQDDRSPVFGVIAIREGHEVGSDAAVALHGVGCAALLTQAAAVAPDRFVIISEGTDRFRLEALDDNDETPYVTGSVTWLDEPLGDPARAARLAAQVLAEVAEFRNLAGAADDPPPTEPNALSYAVAQLIGLDVADRQSLLEAPDTEARLRLARSLVHRERELAASLGTLTQPFHPPRLG
jgi:Lon protease-like protein